MLYRASGSGRTSVREAIELNNQDILSHFGSVDFAYCAQLGVLR